MTKKGQVHEPKEAAQDQVLSRRTAIKRIAAGLLGAGVVAITGLIYTGKGTAWADPVKDQHGDILKKMDTPIFTAIR